MTRFSSIFSQLLQLFPRLEFEQAVKKHNAERGAEGFTSWGQFVAMQFCQFGRAHSLREICGGLASCEGKLKHLGIPEAPKKSTLAYANQHRPWELYQTVFGQVLTKCESMASSSGFKKKFRFKNKLASLDSRPAHPQLNVKRSLLYDVKKPSERCRHTCGTPFKTSMLSCQSADHSSRPLSKRFGLPVVDKRDGRGRAFVRDEIDQETLAIGRHGVLLLVSDKHRTASNANGKQGRG